MSRKALSGWGNSSFDLDGQASKLMGKESHMRSISVDLILTIHQEYSTLSSFAGKQFPNKPLGKTVCGAYNLPSHDIKNHYLRSLEHTV